MTDLKIGTEGDKTFTIGQIVTGTSGDMVVILCPKCTRATKKDCVACDGQGMVLRPLFDLEDL